MNVEELRHLTLVQAVLLRPRMYTVSGSLSELLAFFSGCVNPGLNEPRDDGSVTCMLQWLRAQLSFESEYVLPERIYKTAIAHYGDEASAIHAIRVQFLDPSDLVETGAQSES